MNIEHSPIETEKFEAASTGNADYEAPAIESVLTPESLEREVHYAGIVVGSGTAAA